MEAAMCFVVHGLSASYHLSWGSDAARAAGVHGRMLTRVAEALWAEGVHWLDLGSVDSERAPGPCPVQAWDRGGAEAARVDLPGLAVRRGPGQGGCNREDAMVAVTEEMVETYQRDGVVLIRGLWADWVEMLRAGVARNMANPTSQMATLKPGERISSTIIATGRRCRNSGR